MKTLTITNVCKTLKGREVLKDVNLSFESGNIYGFQGKNGSGKTMLFRAISGLVRIDSGEINVFGKRIGKDVSFPESLGLTIENVGLWKQFTGAECLETLRRVKNKAPKTCVSEALTRVGLEPDDKRKYSAYSLGMKQKLAIAQAIMERPDLLILDEPGNGLDEAAAERLYNIISEEKQRGALVLISSHDGDFLQGLCDLTIKIADGKICA
ncbi:MAG: ABC transporter ATP-binding protein [Oscillospiraceae bacterium]|jgi:ABC-2 type transport system ATP-binding protein|nr:ABC transporter ATP-binding protein [Oscillospiraceae bacterium]